MKKCHRTGQTKSAYASCKPWVKKIENGKVFFDKCNPIYFYVVKPVKKKFLVVDKRTNQVISDKHTTFRSAKTLANRLSVKDRFDLQLKGLI